MAISAGALVAVPHGHAVDTVKHGTVAESVTTAKVQSGSASSAGAAAADVAIAKLAHAGSISLNAVTTSYQAKHAKATDTSASQAHVAHVAHVAHEAHMKRQAQIAAQAHAAHLAHLAHLNHRVQAGSASAAAHEAHLAHLAHLNHSSGHSSSSSSHTSTTAEVSHSAPVASHGHYSCSALESLWESAGGSSSTAFMAAEIATAESGGNPNAVSPTDDFGLWQINGSHGSMATLDPVGNARAAISISNDGHSWGAWTTYTSGAYSGRC
jgi:hypothetical protein